MRPARLEALADGIFAIVMTLLILELHAPEVLAEGQTLSSALFELWPKMVSFITSFIVLGIYWTGHHIQFTKIKRGSFTLTWLNLLFFMAVSIVPFSTGLLGTHPFSTTAQWLYGINLIACGVFLYSAWAYALKVEGMVDMDTVSDELKRNAKHKTLLPPFFYFLGMIVALVNSQISLVLFVMGPLTYFLPVDSKAWRLITSPFGRSFESAP